MRSFIILYIAAAFLYNGVITEKVSETDCTKNSIDQCGALSNAECDNAASNPKCKCSDGYKEDSTDDSTCIKIKVSETSCMKDSTEQCAAKGNAECDNTGNTHTCRCSDGYKEDSVDGSTCVKKKVSETDCMKDSTDQCAALGNAECDSAANNNKCKCSDGYKEDSADGSTCVKKKVSETDCMKDSTDQCAAISNAECDNVANNPKCKCSDGYKEDSAYGSTCLKNDSGNSAPSFVLAANMMSVPLLVTLYLILG